MPKSRIPLRASKSGGTFLEEIAGIDPNGWFFVDESGADNLDDLTHGRGPVGERVHGGGARPLGFGGR